MLNCCSTIANDWPICFSQFQYRHRGVRHRSAALHCSSLNLPSTTDCRSSILLYACNLYWDIYQNRCSWRNQQWHDEAISLSQESFKRYQVYTIRAKKLNLWKYAPVIRTVCTICNRMIGSKGMNIALKDPLYENPAYGRHWISWPMRIVALIPKKILLVWQNSQKN